MTILYTAYFKLDLSHLNIKFSEENDFYEKDLIKQYSFPFKIPKQRGFIPFFEFISSHNSANENTLINATLFRNGNFYEAELMIIGIKKDIEAVIYFSKNKLTIYNRPLNSLPWEVLEIGNNIFDFANTTKGLDYPATPINFVQIYDPEKHKSYDYGQYVNPFTTSNAPENGNFINHCDDGFFIDSEILPDGTVVQKMNEMRPFIYIPKIIEFIFNEIGYTVQGDIINNTHLNKALQYHDNSIFYTNKDLLKTIPTQFAYFTYNVPVTYPTTIGHSKFIHTVDFDPTFASYNIKVEITGMLRVAVKNECRLLFVFNNEVFAEKAVQHLDPPQDGDFELTLEARLNIPPNSTTHELQIQMVTPNLVENTVVGTIEIKGTPRPLYKPTLNMASLLPDVTVGNYINAVKESFNLTSIFNEKTKIVTFNFFKSFISNTATVDLSKYAQIEPSRRLNKKTGYKIEFKDAQVLYLDKTGEFVFDAIGFDKISIPLQPLHTLFIDVKPNVRHQNGLSVLFYKANTKALPLINNGDVSYTRYGFIHHFLRVFLYQELNAEEYNSTMDVPIFEALKIESSSKLKMHNNYFTPLSLKRENKNSLFEKINGRFLKLKNAPYFNFGLFSPNVVVGYLNVDNSTFPATTIFTQALTIVATVTYLDANFGGSSAFITCNIIADRTTDPQGLDMFYEWETVSTPSGNIDGEFIALNAEQSNVTFKILAVSNISGDYTVKLKVTNSEGLSTQNIITLLAY